MKYQRYDRDTLEYIYTQITKLEVASWNKYENKTAYSKGMNKAFRDCVRVLTSILNDELLSKSD